MTQSLSIFDLPTLHRHAIGFDRLFEELNRTMGTGRGADNYPPYNVIKLDDTHFVIEVAVAGFSENDLDVELKENVLTIKGEQVKKDEQKDVEYQHRGISARSFTRTFTLQDMEVRGATVKNGILAVALEQVIPEEQKPKKIQITFAK